MHCWNAASSRVKINILETANVGSCMLLNLVAWCKVASQPLLTSLNQADQGSHSVREVQWQTVSLLLMDSLHGMSCLLSLTWASSGRLLVCTGAGNGVSKLCMSENQC